MTTSNNSADGSNASVCSSLLRSLAFAVWFVVVVGWAFGIVSQESMSKVYESIFER